MTIAAEAHDWFNRDAVPLICRGFESQGLVVGVIEAGGGTPSLLISGSRLPDAPFPRDLAIIATWLDSEVLQFYLSNPKTRDRILKLQFIRLKAWLESAEAVHLPSLSQESASPIGTCVLSLKE